MAALSAERAAQARARVPVDALRAQIAAAPTPKPLSLDSFILIAEIKRTSPSAGPLQRPDDNIIDRATAYARGGATAISILTEPTRFHGSLDDLREIAAALAVPAMRKDFLVDPYQVLEARAAGASGILLITKILSDQTLAEMLALAAELHMFTLIECFDREDLDRCHSLQQSVLAPILIGLNTRNLRDLSIDTARLRELATHFPPGFPRIAESGLHTPEDVRRAAELGYTGVLIGSALMQSPDPAALCREMLGAAASIPHTGVRP
jgi:indole-3-glycerol phosphate synthase